MNSLSSRENVTPHVGVWIETWIGQPVLAVDVTPHVGVWIETSHLGYSGGSGRSRPTWACGLKPPTVGTTLLLIMSRPTWACGLKQDQEPSRHRPKQSRPTWACGLKHRGRGEDNKRDAVTPHVGVWIETLILSLGFFWVLSRPTWACGLKLVGVWGW